MTTEEKRKGKVGLVASVESINLLPPIGRVDRPYVTIAEVASIFLSKQKPPYKNSNQVPQSSFSFL